MTKENEHRQNLSRRGLLKAAALGAGAVSVPLLARAGQAATAGNEPARPLAFSHPGMLHTQADFDRMANRVAAGTQPWVSGWNPLTANAHSAATWAQRPTVDGEADRVVRFGPGDDRLVRRPAGDVDERRALGHIPHAHRRERGLVVAPTGAGEPARRRASPAQETFSLRTPPSMRP